LISGKVEVALAREGKEIVKVKKRIDGKGIIPVNIPPVEEGEYEIRIKGDGFEDRARVRVENSFIIFVETDKPIYKPGQTAHLRVITLDAELKPVGEVATLEIMDAKGIKIFRRELETDEYGMATLDLPISEEPNLGVWKITALADKGRTQLDIRVEEYVLPKYEVRVELPKEWFLASEPVKGKVLARYSFGKPVQGELEITARRYVGEWQEYTSFSKVIDGETQFELPAVGYVAGVPEARGMGNVMLEVAVREKATGYEEKSSKLLTVSEVPLSIQIIPGSSIFKPGLPFRFLLITESPDNRPVDVRVNLTATYLDDDLKEAKKEDKEIQTRKGKAMVEITPPEKGVALILECSADGAEASKVVEASYSPSGNFIHIEQTSEGIPQVGEKVEFKVYSTREAANFYYEVVSRDMVVFTDFTRNREISFETTPLMAPASNLLVYQILPNSEVAADYIPFKVEAEYPHSIKAGFSQDEARPGDKLDIDIKTDGKARVGIVAVDKSVFILAENRLNLQQVFGELERLYMEPQAELHEVSLYPTVATKGAREVFDKAGVVVMSNKTLPEGAEYQWERQPGIWRRWMQFLDGGVMMMEKAGVAPAPQAAPDAARGGQGAGLAEVERIRQYFPETWLWDQVTTDFTGRASLQVEVPDTITTWMLRTVALSKEKGLGMAEDELRAFQPFFVKIDLPYSAIRGEEFPIKVAIYNYLDKPQRVLVEIQEDSWFDLRDKSAKTVDIAANDIGGAEFKISPTGLGLDEVKVTVRSPEAADAVIKKLLVLPEGIAKEMVDNLVLSDGKSRMLDTSIPPFAVTDSGRAYVAVTSSYLTQTIEGLDALIQMPFGCGEQNMILFAPDVYITKYLKESGQLKPEIMAKAEKLMITGYQRELTYRRSDGSFSAFGQSDAEGSLWLTAFVLKSFSQAKDLIFIDEAVLERAKDWIITHQNKDGSFDPIGFVHHQEMMGGLKGKIALTAYVALALMEAGERDKAHKAVKYLEDNLAEIDDAYTVAITAYALELAESDRSEDAHRLLMEMAREDEDGLHWGTDVNIQPQQPMRQNQSADIEATAYAALALVKHGDAFNASRAAKWLVSQRNAFGGFGSTQDTVVALQALTEYATGARAEVDLRISIVTGEEEKELKIKQDNYDVLQIVEVPIDEEIEIRVKGKGEAIAQLVRRFNLPEAEKGEEILKVKVDYDATQVEVDDVVNVSVELEFAPPVPMEAGMVVLDISVPTGFSPVLNTIAEVAEKEDKIKRYELAGRKVIFYIENMQPGDKLSFSFSVKAMYPVKAKATSSQAYSYYKPEIRSETLSESITVN
jgi:CD109 antigen